MTLHDIIIHTDEEITVWDKDYDIETYFYGTKDSSDETDDWDKSIIELSKMLDVVSISKRGITVNLAEVIEKSIPKLETADLFIRCDIDSIMNDIMRILAGNVSEEWLKSFVDTLKSNEEA